MRPIFWLVFTAVLGYASGLSLEVVAEGEDSKLMELVRAQANPELTALLNTAQMTEVQSVWDDGEVPFFPIVDTGYMSKATQNMISSAYIDFKIEKIPKTNPETQSKYFSNEVTQCIVQPKEALEFDTCMVCTLKGTKLGQGPEDQEIGKGEKEFPNGFPAGVPQTLEIQEINEGFSNDVRYVHGVKLEVCKSPECVPQFLDFTEFPHGTREAAINSALASAGIKVSADAYSGGVDEVIIFDADKTGTPDPDLQVGNGLHLLIIPVDVDDEENNETGNPPQDGLVDEPNDSANGGTIFLRFDIPYFLESFVFVDKDNNKQPAEARAYDAKYGGNLIKTVPIPSKGDKSIQTITMNAANVQRLEVNYKDSGGITNIKLLCQPPRDGQGCTPGFWKQEHHFKFWQGYNPDDNFGTVFGITSDVELKSGDKLKSVTLLEALKAQGGGINALARHAVAALLNAASLNYAFSEQEVKDSVKEAIDSESSSKIEDLKDKLEKENERGCPFGNGKDENDEKKEEHKKQFDSFHHYFDDWKNRYNIKYYKQTIEDYKKYFDDNSKDFDKENYKKYMDYYKKLLNDNRWYFDRDDYKKLTDAYKKYSDEYKNHGDRDKDDNDKKENRKKDDYSNIVFEGQQCRGVKSLTVEYEGALSEVDIKVKDRAVGKKMFKEIESGEDEITIKASKKNKLNRVTFFKIYNDDGNFVDYIKIPTSCKYPLNHGDSFYGKRGMPVNMHITNVEWFFK